MSSVRASIDDDDRLANERTIRSGRGQGDSRGTTLFWVPLLGGPVEKMSLFQIVHMTKVSTQIHSSISQYDVYNRGDNDKTNY